jgi:pSer/pThr/pTyr-binding forkhead associated (FHA) protein
MWKLVIEDDEGKRTVVPLTRDQYSIGRKEGNTIRLTERNVSREHARVFKKAPNGAADKPTYALEDLTSYNGVFVNGLRITHAQDLAHGDLVQIGDYRIILQDDTLADVAASAGAAADVKATMPNTPAARAASLLDRPNRLVMLAGPTPGAEFPLDRERMTIGRAEDAHISINHNSVSRLHCEVHALGDGRFEIVDKGSSNGVRVNGAELRRGIIEPGDVIELGDVKFKFIGAGQIFRPTESQQLALLGDREADAIIRRRRGSNAVPFAIFGIVVAMGAAAAWVLTRPKVEPATAATTTTTMAVAPSADQSTLDEAKRLCAGGDCEAAHEKLASIADGSPLRSTQDFKDIENRWADELLARGDAAQDVAKKRASYQRVAQAMTVDPSRRKEAADKLQQLDMIAGAAATAPLLPAASVKEPPGQPVAAARPDGGRRTALAPEMTAREHESTPTSVASPPATAVTSTPRSGGGSVDDRERQLALAGTQDAKLLLKQQLEQRVYANKATDTEINLLISTCKDLGDKLCVQKAREIKTQRQQAP